MSDAITTLLVQIKGDATSAVQALKDFATANTTAATQVTVAQKTMASAGASAAAMGQELEKAGKHVGGMSYYFRSFFDSMRFAMLGNPMAAFYMVDEGVRAMVASGLGLGKIIPIIGTVGAAIGGSFLVWEALGNHMDRDAEKAKNLEKIPAAVKRAYDLQKQGAIDEGQRKQIESILGGAPAQIVGGTKANPVVELVRSLIDQHVTGAFNPLAGAKSFQSGPMGIMVPPSGQNNPSPDAQQRLDAANAMMDAAAKAHQSKIASSEVAQADKDQQAQQIKQQKIAAENARTQEQTLARLQRGRQQELRAIEEAEQKQKEADRQHEEDLKRQAQLTRDIQRSAIENQIDSVKSNALMTDREKLQIVSALQTKLQQINNTEIAELEALKAQVKSVSDQLELEKKIADLQNQNQKLSEANTPAKQNSFGFQFGSAATDIQNRWTGWATEAAKSFQSTWEGATNGVSAGLTHLFEYGAQKGQWFREIWNGVVGSMISSFTQMAVSWVMNHVLMEVAAVAFL
jgi:hypothetical protein